MQHALLKYIYRNNMKLQHTDAFTTIPCISVNFTPWFILFSSAECETVKSCVCFLYQPCHFFLSSSLFLLRTLSCSFFFFLFIFCCSPSLTFARHLLPSPTPEEVTLERKKELGLSLCCLSMHE